ncbi:2647_t:CDS:2 [Paraglomus brasilianum]|uniref:2647_t:CDS:1 n=1 Tax=Paraglomus brasilianum TaxID=144538 RepID=A0A9N8ZF51_9GLOM|nr:2647_t:CDS:2 [Paraglomus brasilianum]
MYIRVKKFFSSNTRRGLNTMVNKISFFETSLFRFLTRRDATFNVSSITADDLLAYYRQENPIHKPFQIYNVIVKDLEQAIASKFFSEDIIDSLKGIRDNWQEWKKSHLKHIHEEWNDQRKTWFKSSVNKYQQSVATIVDTEIGKWCEEAVNDMESLSLKHSLEHSENEEDGLPGKVQQQEIINEVIDEVNHECDIQQEPNLSETLPEKYVIHGVDIAMHQKLGNYEAAYYDVLDLS